MHNSQFKLMVTYFLLATAIITSFWVVNNLDVIGGVIAWILGMLSPFIVGFVISYILGIPINAVQRLLERTHIEIIRQWKKGISIVSVYLAFVFLIYMTIQLLVPPIIATIVDFIANFPVFYQQVLSFLENLGEEFLIDLSPDHILHEVLGEDFNINNPLGFITYDAILSYLGTIMGGAAALFNLFLAFISSIYFLFELENLSKFLKRLMFAFSSVKTSTIILEYGQKINQYFKKYIFCLLMDCIIMAVVGTVVLTLLGSEYALLLGLMIGAMNLIPYFGSIIATIIAVVVVWITQGFAMGAFGAIVLFICQQLDANVIQPRLYGTSLKLSPLLVIVSVSVGGSIGGLLGSTIGGTILGMIVAIPFAKVFMNILEDIITHRELKKPKT
ncbi:MAG: AI-2E family transporter [Turicibacter sp.]|nr:AI-2E family transporter [Turicibacter sp.]